MGLFRLPANTIALFLIASLCLLDIGCSSGSGSGKKSNGGSGSVTVSSVSPNSGDEAGGTEITIVGSNFGTGATVTIGGTSATIVTATDTSITCTTPSKNQGTYDVTVTNNNGISGTMSQGFTYIKAQQPAPTVTSITPNSGPYNQSQSVKIDGTNFVTGAEVTFISPDNSAQLPGVNVVVSSSIEINCDTPTVSSTEIGKTYTVRVRNPDTQSASILGYTYVNERWERTLLNAPNTGRPKVWNVNQVPIFPRGGHRAVWAGNKMLVWGRNTSHITRDYGPFFDQANPFDPDSGLEGDTITLNGIPGLCYFAPTGISVEFNTTGGWTSAANVSWINEFTLQVKVPTVLESQNCQIRVTNPDKQYDITRDTFFIQARGIVVAAVPPTRDEKTALGGYNIGATLSVGATQAEDNWSEISLTNSPIRRNGYTVVWTGSKLIVWGGYDDRGQPNYYNTGAIYDPSTKTWAAMSTTNAPKPRAGHTALWTSERMFVWGGHNNEQSFGDGGLYNPATDTWTSILDTSVISPRCYHSAVPWTGTTVILWGGLSKPYVPGDTISPTPRRTGALFTVREDAVIIESLPVPDGTGGQPDVPTRYRHTAVWHSATETPSGNNEEMIIWGGVTDITGPVFTNTGARYNPYLKQWYTTTTTNAPSARAFHTAAFMRPYYMAIWGGTDDYDDDTQEHQPVPIGNGRVYIYDHTGTLPEQWLNLVAGPDGGPENLNVAPFGHSAVVFTDAAGVDKMILWGGNDLADDSWEGGKGWILDPTNQTWERKLFVGNSPPRAHHTAIVNPLDNTMIVWGGSDRSVFSTRYNHGAIFTPPVTEWREVGTWAKVTTTSVPRKRDKHTAIWTEGLATPTMIVWGGGDETAVLKDGASYDPTGAGTWTAIANPPAAIETRDRHTAIWTGTEMIVWGGATIDGLPLQSGARYTPPPTNTWSATLVSTTGAPTARFSHTAVWTTGLTTPVMVVWGGEVGTGGVSTSTGGRYDPTTNTWQSTSTGLNAPGARYDHTALWITWGTSNRRMIVWGGRYTDTSTNEEVVLKDGAMYNPVDNTWASTSTSGKCPSARYGHTALWSGTKMYIWGGTNGSQRYNDGGVYDPSTNSWSEIKTFNAPIGRYRHTAVWMSSISAMIVFGGFYEDFLASGGIFYPQSSRWQSFGE